MLATVLAERVQSQTVECHICGAWLDGDTEDLDDLKSNPVHDICQSCESNNCYDSPEECHCFYEDRGFPHSLNLLMKRVIYRLVMDDLDS